MWGASRSSGSGFSLRNLISSGGRNRKLIFEFSSGGFQPISQDLKFASTSDESLLEFGHTPRRQHFRIYGGIKHDLFVKALPLSECGRSVTSRVIHLALVSNQETEQEISV